MLPKFDWDFIFLRCPVTCNLWKSPSHLCGQDAWFGIVLINEIVTGHVCVLKFPIMYSFHRTSTSSNSESTSPSLLVLDGAGSRREFLTTHGFVPILTHTIIYFELQQVMMVLLDASGTDLVTLQFNGTGSNKNNWFSRDRLVSSPYADIQTEPVNVFSLEGWVYT